MNSLNHIVLKLFMLLVITNSIFANAYDLKVRVQLEETGKTLTDYVPMAFTSQQEYLDTSILQSDSTFLFKELKEENLLIVYKLGDIYYAEPFVGPKDYFIVSVPQANIASSTDVEQLSELTVEGSNQYTEANKTIFIPTKKEKKVSRGGIDLIDNMSISSLYVDPMTKAVTTAAGDGVKFFIDMQPASQTQIEMLRAMDIQTVEFLESPADPRFQGARYVINYVLVKYEFGGYTVLSAQQRFIQNLGNYNVYSRYTQGKMLYDFGGGFNYHSDSHVGSDNISTYHFPDFDVTRTSSNLGGKTTRRNGYGTFQAIYQSDKVTIANSIGISGSNTPMSTSYGNVKYTSNFYPEEQSSRYSHRSNFSLVWDGNYFFAMPYDFSLSVTPAASYATYRSCYSYIEGALTTNDSRDRAWTYRILAHLQKKFGRQSVGIRLSNDGSGNNVSYSGTISSAAKGNSTGGVFDLSANINFGKFWAAGNAGGKYFIQTISGVKSTTVAPALFVQAGYNFTTRSSLSMYSNYSPYTTAMNQKTDNFVLLNNIDAVKGNPNLKDGHYFNLGLRYNLRPSRKLNISAYWTFTRMSNMIVNSYEPKYYMDRLIMLQTLVNDGFINTHDYGLNLSYSLLNSNLRLYGGVQGRTVARHSQQYYNGTYLRFFANATYFLDNFYVKAAYNYHRTSVGNYDIRKSPAYYNISAGWGNGNWNIEVSTVNPSVGNYKSGSSFIQTPTFSSETHEFSGAYHRVVMLSVAYNFSYGKKITKSDGPQQMSGGASGILDYE